MRLQVISKEKAEKGSWVDCGDAKFLIRRITGNGKFEAATYAASSRATGEYEMLRERLAAATKDEDHSRVGELQAKIQALNASANPGIYAESVLVDWEISTAKDGGKDKQESVFFADYMRKIYPNSVKEEGEGCAIEYSTGAAKALLDSDLVVDGDSFIDWVASHALDTKNYASDRSNWAFLGSNSPEPAGGNPKQPKSEVK